MDGGDDRRDGQQGDPKVEAGQPEQAELDPGGAVQRQARSSPDCGSPAGAAEPLTPGLSTTRFYLARVRPWPTSGYALAVGGYRLPEDFASQLERVTAPGEAPDVATVIGDALRLDDARLAAFLERFAARIASSGEPVRARELRAMLDG
jgi:hypothetical protein